ncbi:MAG: PASTA domain-containing protein [Candidatus Viridilinea halotolerans]|uniref:PASTA domain-containing protein n=1 Tax=Candidatus Viridilinea halotolerans TaxID=2491704 RepID=A0A426TRR5_9CHLR|nr:MAG: PASTA domain-containing protein [Candidatus Viridilinea halotolerans]
MTPMPNQASADPRLCYVPDLSGVPFDSARDILWAQYEGFNPDNLTKPNGTRSNMIIAAGSQSIPAGSMVDCNSTMSVTEQTGSCVVPNMIGETWTSALAKWQSAGFPDHLLQRGAGIDDETIVGSQSITQGSVVISCNQSVTLDVSTCTVPNFVGRTYPAQALIDWELADFDDANLSPAANSPASFVIGSQSLIANTQVSCQSQITVDPLPVCIVPQMVGRTVAESRTDWSGAGFSSEPTFSKNNPRAADYVRSQSEPAGKELDCDTGITLTEETRVVIINVVSPSVQPGAVVTRADSPNIRIRAEAYDSDSNGTNGTNVNKVSFTVTRPNGTQLSSGEEGARPYCAWGDAYSGGEGIPCYSWNNGAEWEVGTYTVTISSIKVYNTSTNQLNNSTLKYSFTVVP